MPLSDIALAIEFLFTRISSSSERIANWIRSDEGLTLETSAFRISVRWPIYIINSVDKTKIFAYIFIFSYDKQMFNDYCYRGKRT